MILFLVRTIFSSKFQKNVWWCTLFTHFNSSFKTEKILSSLLIQWICLNSWVFRSSHQNSFCKKDVLETVLQSIYETFVKLLFVYNSAKDEFLLKYFRTKYLYLLVATFCISKQLVSTKKKYSSDKKLSLIKTTLKHVCF